MSSDFKRYLRAACAILTLLAVLVCAAACAKAPQNPKQTSKPDSVKTSTEAPSGFSSLIGKTENGEDEAVKVPCSEAYKNGGFYMLVAKKSTDLKAETAGAADWEIYVLDEKPGRDPSVIRQQYEPVLTGDGSFSVNEGQYVYCWCSINSSSSSVADENSALYIYGAGLARE